MSQNQERNEYLKNASNRCLAVFGILLVLSLFICWIKIEVAIFLAVLAIIALLLSMESNILPLILLIESKIDTQIEEIKKMIKQD